MTTITETADKIWSVKSEKCSSIFHEGNEYTDPLLNEIKNSNERLQYFGSLLDRIHLEGELINLPLGTALAIKDFYGISDEEYNIMQGIN